MTSVGRDDRRAAPQDEPPALTEEIRKVRREGKPLPLSDSAVICLKRRRAALCGRPSSMDNDIRRGATHLGAPPQRAKPQR